MKKLIKGLHHFQTEVFPIQKNFFESLLQGQSPDILFITCSDSRINPHLVTSADPGDLFIIRNAGNIIPRYGILDGEAATIEFAVSQLKIKHIIICGHSHCSAIESALHLEDFSHLPLFQRWIKENITPTLELVRKNYPDCDSTTLTNILTQEHLLQQLDHLRTYPTIQAAIAQQQLTLHAWVYKFETGDIFSYNAQEEQFERIKHL